MRHSPVACLIGCFALGLLVEGCGGGTPRPGGGGTAGDGVSEVGAPTGALERALDEAGAGVESPELRELLRTHWAWELEQQPLAATRLGVHTYDDRLADDSHEAIEKRRAFVRDLLSRAHEIERLTTGRDAVTTELFVAMLEGQAASFLCDFHQWTLSPRQNPITELNDLHEVHAVTSVESGTQLIHRYEAGARSIRTEMANLERGAARGLYATNESARRVLDMVNKQLAEPIASWPMLKPAEAAHEGWPAHALAAFRVDLRRAVEEGIRPALEAYAAFIEKRILPNARSDEDSGLRSLPEIGMPCYEARVRDHTTLKLSAQEIHDIGMREIARIDQELATLGARALGTSSLAETLAKLRLDETLYFETEDQVAEAAQEALDAAKAKIGDYFGVLPKTDCIIRRIPDYEAPYTTIAYYKPPHADGTKPGEYFVNVYHPATRPRYEARVLAMHEAIPGHHLQIAIAQEQAALPAFRKHGGVTAYVEGWALYTERLADEMGLYRDDLDRIGVASFDAWRAGRLVVDTGIHAMGWSRAKAERFLEDHTALSLDNIDNEVDRYIVWPGQALAYKLGQLEIRRLRADAEAKLGVRFSLPAFHDTVLSTGAVTLPVLGAHVARFIEERGAGSR